MSHKNKAEQIAWKARKDPKKLAWPTKAHTPKSAYKRERVRVDELMKEYTL